MRRTRTLTVAATLIGLGLAPLAASSASATSVEQPSRSATLPSRAWVPLAGTAAATDSTFVDGRGVAHYRFDPRELPGHRLVMDSGQRQTDGCTFEGSGSGKPAHEQQFTRVIEVSFDAASCTRVLAVATYGVSKLPDVVRKSLGSDDPAAVVASESTTADTFVDSESTTADTFVASESTAADTFTAAAAATYSGYLKANVEDPPQLNVSSTRSSITWSATSSCVTSSTRSPYWYWLSGSGWSRTSGTIPSNESNCTHAYLNVVGKFKNDAFCPGSGNTTYTDHSKTVFEGKPGGGYYWSYQMNKSGGCSSLLSYDYDLSHP